MKIMEYLKESGTVFTTHEHAPAYTAQEIAAEEHVSGNILSKCVVVRTDKGFAICVLPASCKLDMQKAARALRTSDLRLADESEMADLFPDVEIGAEPPFGNLYKLPTVVDRRLSQEEEIVFQGGTHSSAVRMNYEDYAQLAKPIVADLSTRQ